MNSDHDPELEAFLMGKEAERSFDAVEGQKEAEQKKIAESDSNLRKMKTYFLKRDPLEKSQEIKPIGPESVDEVMPTEVTEQTLMEYANLCQQIKDMEDVKEELRTRILELMGREESIIRGRFLCEVQNQTSTKTDWKAFCKAQFNKPGLEELIKPYQTEEEKQVLRVRKVGK